MLLKGMPEGRLKVGAENLRTTVGGRSGERANSGIERRYPFPPEVFPRRKCCAGLKPARGIFNEALDFFARRQAEIWRAATFTAKLLSKL